MCPKLMLGGYAYSTLPQNISESWANSSTWQLFGGIGLSFTQGIAIDYAIYLIATNIMLKV